MKYKFEIGESARILGTPHVGRITNRRWSFKDSSNPKNSYIVFSDFPRYYTLKIGKEGIELEIDGRKLERVSFQAVSIIEGLVERPVAPKTPDN